MKPKPRRILSKARERGQTIAYLPTDWLSTSLKTKLFALKSEKDLQFYFVTERRVRESRSTRYIILVSRQERSATVFNI